MVCAGCRKELLFHWSITRSICNIQSCPTLQQWGVSELKLFDWQPKFLKSSFVIFTLALKQSAWTLIWVHPETLFQNCVKFFISRSGVRSLMWWDVAAAVAVAVTRVFDTIKLFQIPGVFFPQGVDSGLKLLIAEAGRPTEIQRLPSVFARGF